jgi:hypothetical protein
MGDSVFEKEDLRQRPDVNTTSGCLQKPTVRKSRARVRDFGSIYPACCRRRYAIYAAYCSVLHSSGAPLAANSF